MKHGTMSHSFDVVYEDNHLLVVNKPPLLATMGVDEATPSLVREAKAYLKKKYNKPGNVYLGIVSRLDSFTSGLVVLAKTSKAAGRLAKQFAERSTDKFYLCATDPIPDKLPLGLRTAANENGWSNLSVNWKDWIWHDDANRRVQAIAVNQNANQPQGAKLGELNWRKIGSVGKRQLNLVKLQTGRKHQIRIQFSSRGCPIVGDRKYESAASFRPGIALHAWLLGFRHPVGAQPLGFAAPIPESWQNLGNFSPIAATRDIIARLPADSRLNTCNDYLDHLAKQWQTDRSVAQ